VENYAGSKIALISPTPLSDYGLVSVTSAAWQGYEALTDLRLTATACGIVKPNVHCAMWAPSAGAFALTFLASGATEVACEIGSKALET